MKIKLSKSQWTLIGNKTGWLKLLKTANTTYQTNGLTFTISLQGTYDKGDQYSPPSYPDLNIDNIEINDQSQLFSLLKEQQDFENKLNQIIEEYTNKPTKPTKPTKLTIKYIGLNISININEPNMPSQIQLNNISINNLKDLQNSTLIQNIVKSHYTKMEKSVIENFEEDKLPL